MNISLKFFEEFYNFLRPYELLAKTNFERISTIKNLKEFSLKKCNFLKHRTDLPDLKKKFEEIEHIISEIEERTLPPKVVRRVYSILAETFYRHLKTFIETSLYMLDKRISVVKGIGDNLKEAFSERGIRSIKDLLFFLPVSYQDRRRVLSIKELRPGVPALVRGKVVQSGVVNYSSRKVYEALITDETGFLNLKWFTFNRKVMESVIQNHLEYYFYGVPKMFGNRMEMVHPEISKEANFSEGIIPVYKHIRGATQKHLRKVLKGALQEYKSYIISAVPPSIEKMYSMPSLAEAVLNLHNPSDGNIKLLDEGQSPYHKRVLFEEIFMLEYALLLRKKFITGLRGVIPSMRGELLKKVMSTLRFRLTNAQKRVLAEIEGDLRKGKLIHRLIQGDVGSGKTVVVILASLYFIEDGYQVAIMVPTEILALQHYMTITEYLKNTGIKTVLLTRGVKDKSEVKEMIRNGEADLIIGTHALIQEGIEFHSLAFIVMDEQHRFGVLQRAKLKRKGEFPHMVVMSATPIPRTLAMTIYGDLDVSVIDELPPGRKPVKTTLYRYRDIDKVWNRVREEMNKGGSVFVVYPLIEDSEKLELRSANDMYEKMKRKIFPEFPVGFIHGRMKEDEKRDTMEKFREGELRLLVSTTVIEVGVDVPSATLMVIEHAERFGLSQLHQLRGRVGRSESDAECILLTDEKAGEKAWKRLSIMTETNDGFKIAEEDLKIRGPGEVLGTRQWGMRTSEVVRFLGDVKLLKKAKEAVMAVISEGGRVPDWEKEIASTVVKHYKGEMLELGMVG